LNPSCCVVIVAANSASELLEILLDAVAAAVSGVFGF